ncbi:sensor histidine kinase [Nonomuraea polychroma]|uniref:sensor histidine kinase n=1 Tax=Nonomuraea polychroma TaxID=46176 RepID=UPI0013E2B7C0|nr:histidine kinase [Nonomuraea polychroma]
MHDRTENRLAPDQWGTTLPYVCAVLPMLFRVTVIGSGLSRNPDLLPMALADVGLGVIGLVLMGWRRRWPWQIALATALLHTLSSTAGGPAYVAYVSLCMHRRWRQIIPVAAVAWLCVVGRATLPAISEATDVSIATGTIILGGLTVFGLYFRGRQELATSRQEMAWLAERQQLQLIEQAKLAERLKIAQEMHDVLAHRISLLSMLAGGLAYRKDLTAEETREVALAIQENAHQSLNELRTVLGTLRRDGAIEAPQPNLGHLDALFDEVCAAGQHVDVDDTIADRELLPTQTGRHAYRIVQEALTNARKHAPGSRVTVELAGRPGHGLRIRVSNPAPSGTAAGPGGRMGLVGLAERIRMADGTLSHAAQEGRFILDARLPWEALHRDSIGDRG